MAVCRGPDSTYYLTGTTGHLDMWAVTGDIKVWKSTDLKNCIDASLFQDDDGEVYSVVGNGKIALLKADLVVPRVRQKLQHLPMRDALGLKVLFFLKQIINIIWRLLNL